MTRVVTAIALLTLVACGGMPPLRHRIGTGQDPYVVFVADAADGRGDLWAVAPGGGRPIQITFTPPAEFGAALSPDGIQIGFIRSRNEADTALRTLSVFNLLNGAERALPLPKEAGYPLALAWAPDGRRIFVRTTGGLWRLDAPPEPPEVTPVPAVARAAAESLFSVLVGDPPFARVVPCDNASDLCVLGDSGLSVLAPDGREPMLWGTDSVAYLVGDEIVVRALGVGRSRVIRLSGMRNPRSFSYFPGQPRNSLLP